MNEIINQWLTTIVALIFGGGSGVLFTRSQMRKQNAEANMAESEALSKMRGMYNDFVLDYEAKFTGLLNDYEIAKTKVMELTKKLTEIEKRCSKCAFKPKETTN